MLVIRKDQFDIFTNLSMAQFENRTLGHLTEVFNRHVQAMGEKTTRHVIEYGIGQAKKHGLTTVRSVWAYLDLMLMFGSHFDHDPQLPWASKALAENAFAAEAAVVDRLTSQARDYFSRVAGKKAVFFDQALLRISQNTAETMLDVNGRTAEPRALPRLKWLYPKKYEYVGEQVLRSLAGEATIAAEKYGISSDNGKVLFTGFMFILGSGFDLDPQFPWITAILNDSHISDQHERVNKLYQAAQSYLEGWLLSS